MIGLAFTLVAGGFGLLAFAMRAPRSSSSSAPPAASAPQAPAAAAAPPAAEGEGQSSSEGAKAGAVAIGAALGTAAGQAVDKVVTATGGTDSTQKTIIASAGTVLGAGAGAAVALGAAAATAAAVAGPALIAVVSLSGVVSAIANAGRGDANDKRREDARAAAVKGISASSPAYLAAIQAADIANWKADVARVAKSGLSATEVIQYREIDLKYVSKGATDPRGTSLQRTIGEEAITVSPPTTGAGWADLYDIFLADLWNQKAGTVVPITLTAELKAQIVANAKAKAVGDNKAAAIAGFGSGAGAQVAAGTADATGTGAIARVDPRAAQVVGGVAAAGSKSDRVRAAAGETTIHTGPLAGKTLGGLDL